MKEKRCTRCGVVKSLDYFYNEKRALDGRTSQCKLCFSVTQKLYHKKHRKEHNNKCKEYYINNKIKFILLGIKDRCKNTKKHNYNRYGGRGIKCLITEEELQKLWFRDKAYEMKKPSIDRIDNDKDYTYNNCQFLEHNENSVKDKRKPIIRYDLNGNFIDEWISIAEATRKLKILHIHLCCKGLRKTAGGFLWRYKNEQ